MTKIMIDIQLSKSTSIISPRLTVLVNTLDNEGELSSSPYSWIFPLSFNPPLIGVGVGKNKQSHRNAEKTGEFVVCVVSPSFGQEAINCEKLHKPGDKLWEKNNLQIQKSLMVQVPRIKESKAFLECKTKKILEYEGDHVILVGEVVYAQTQETIDEVDPLLHVSGDKFRKIGKPMTIKRNR
jgi:flavin reductase (DIM6/NTAB) family NADH-FMN oxidoreductase RutF